eukprot:16799-Heterococcus_DN1.PRE.2
MKLYGAYLHHLCVFQICRTTLNCFQYSLNAHLFTCFCSKHAQRQAEIKKTHNPSEFDLNFSVDDDCYCVKPKLHSAITNNDKLERCNYLMSPSGDAWASLNGAGSLDVCFGYRTGKYVCDTAIDGRSWTKYGLTYMQCAQRMARYLTTGVVLPRSLIFLGHHTPYSSYSNQKPGVVLLDSKSYCTVVT